MSDSDTAVLCLGEARAWTAARRIATLLAMLVATMSLVSVAAAAPGRLRRQRTPRSPTPPALSFSAPWSASSTSSATSRGLPGLRENARLNRSAQGWTNVMVTHRDFSHGADFAARISAVGFDWSNVGENIATGYATPVAVVKAWMASKGHCQNILNPQYRYVGTGVQTTPSVGWLQHAGPGTWTQDFGAAHGPARPRRATGARPSALPVLGSPLGRTALSGRRRSRRRPGPRTRRGRWRSKGAVSRRYHSASSAAWHPEPAAVIGLAVGVVHEVAGGEHARDVGQRRLALGDDVAAVVGVDLALRRAGTGGRGRRR